MDKDIYPNDTVGESVNKKFISVKVQMDTSKQDNEQVKAWYADAHSIMQQYKVIAFPGKSSGGSCDAVLYFTGSI